MGRSCAICNSKDDKKSSKSFHLFPKNKDSKRQWCEIVGFKMETLSKHDVLCSDHFLSGDICSYPSGLKYIKKGALPKALVIKKLSDTLRGEYFGTTQAETTCEGGALSKGNTFKPKRALLEETTSTENENSPMKLKNVLGTPAAVSSSFEHNDNSATETASEAGRENIKIGSVRKPLPRYFGDVSSDDVRSPRRVRRSLQITKKLVQQQRASIAKLKRANKRLADKVKYYKQLFLFLRENNYLSKSAEMIVQKKFPDIPKLLNLLNRNIHQN